MTPSDPHKPAIQLASYLLLSWATIAMISVEVVSADGPDDNQPAQVRRVPPKGIELTPALRQSIEQQCTSLRTSCLDILPDRAIDRAQILGLIRAVEMTLTEEMFYSDQEVQAGQELLNLAEARLQKAKNGLTGLELILSDAIPKERSLLAIGCFPSKIDASLQPFGIVLPASWNSRSESTKPATLRMDIWLHGRDEKTSEVGFLHRRRNSIGEFAPEGTVVLHPYGRYSNAFKFAGEVDVLEAIDFTKSMLPIDHNRISIRGFSMGGAGCWQIAAHYPDQWFAANPGAGFAETTEFLRLFQKEEFIPTAFQKQLLHLYDCPDWSNNFRYLPLVVYSGELDRQKQAADIMESSLKSKGLPMLHVIGPQTDHKFHPESKVFIEEQMKQWSAKGREEFPKQIDFTTYTLRYPKHSWIRLEQLDEHWTESRIQANRSSGLMEFRTTNIGRFSIELPVVEIEQPQVDIRVLIDGQEVTVSKLDSNADVLRMTFVRNAAGWKEDRAAASMELSKRPGLQGPIDDAFLDPFCFVPPKMKQIDSSSSTLVERWLQNEYRHATGEWKRHFRGDIVEASIEQLSAGIQTDVSSASTSGRNKNWILFGTPENNPIMAKVVDSLPIKWNSREIVVGDRRYSSEHHILSMIYPNPFEKGHYVVFNSGFTFREYAYLNNARQIPMLPDWAVVDIREGANSQLPGKIVDAGFFDEHWRLKDERSERSN